jgi:predicted DNA-binding transcriptional regulator YafY
VYHPITRVLTVLELLQTHGRMTGAELSERLEVDIRTVRRYITMLQDLVRPSHKLPPLMFTAEEALALTLGLVIVQQQELTAETAAAESALTKLIRVLPSDLRARVQAVADALVVHGPAAHPAPVSKWLLTVSSACQRQQRLWLRYGSLAGVQTERLLDPYGVVCYRGRWYLTGYCHLRNDLRLFRLDRVQAVEVREERFVRPADFALLESVLGALGSVPRRWPVEVLLETTLEEAQAYVSADVAVLEQVEQGVLFRCQTDNLAWLARLIANIGCPFVVRQPPELIEALRQHAASIAQSVARSEARQGAGASTPD